LSNIQAIDRQFKGLFDEQPGTEENDAKHRGLGSGFMEKFGWIYQATIVAEHEKIKLDEVYELPIMQFLNDLSYIKAKSAYDADQLKRISNV
jgi:hypothetical protein